MRRPELAQYQCRACGGTGYINGDIADVEWILAHLKNRPNRYLYQDQTGRWLATYPEPGRAVFDGATIQNMYDRNILQEQYPGRSGALSLVVHPASATSST